LGTLFATSLIAPVTTRAQHDVAATPSARTESASVLNMPVTVSFDHVPLAEAIDAVVAKTGVLLSYQHEVVANTHRVVTLHVTKARLEDVFAALLQGTPLRVAVFPGAQLSIVTTGDARAATVNNGVVTGRVTDAQTKQPLHGAMVLLDSAKKGIMTNGDGTFSLANIPAGTHTVRVRLLGYTTMTKSIAVENNESVRLEFPLATNATALNQVVVTGTVMPTEIKAVPTAITVITAKQIEERGITKIDQLFRGDVPGLFAMNTGSSATLDQVTMFSRGATAIGPFGAGTSFGTNPIKTYVDGVELADSKYLSQIDPKSIERIEIVSGPQASTIYGSNAINGVMQIFTKRGATSHPRITLDLQSGFVENNFSAARTPQHDDRVQVSGVDGRVSYNAGGSWAYMGAWTPAKATARTNLYAGERMEFVTPAGVLTTDVTFRQSNTQNRQRGSSEQQGVEAKASGYYNVNYYWGGNADQLRMSVLGQTLGLTVGYTPTSWWSHQFGIGRDVSDYELHHVAPVYRSTDDTLLQSYQTHDNRQSLRYTTTLLVPMTTYAGATITAGADMWQDLQTSLFVQAPVLTGRLSGYTNAMRQPEHNTGGFVQTRLAFDDHLFLTYGLRAEWNPTYGDSAQPYLAPRYGVAYAMDIGPVTAKVRGSYGRSTRPPGVGDKAADVETADFLNAVYGPHDSRLANPDLRPEYQQGGEGGLELYLGTRASLIVTHYNQTVNGLIAPISGVDSVRSLQPNPLFFGTQDCATIAHVWRIPAWCSSQDAQGYGYALVSQNLNVASLRNQGWETQMSVVTGPFTTRGTYSWTKSRSIGPTGAFRAGYAALFQSYPEFQRGATFAYLPEHTSAVGVTYATATTTIALNVTSVGQIRTYYNAFTARSLSGDIRLQQNQLNTNQFRYANISRGYTMADITASRRFSSRVEGVAQVQNLANYYQNDYSGSEPTIGRQTKAGFRISLP